MTGVGIYSRTEEIKGKLSNSLRLWWKERKEKGEVIGSRRGKKLTEEQKRKISKALKDRIFSEVHKEKISLGLKGRKCTEEHKKNMSEAGKRKVFSLEHRLNLSKVNSGINNPFYGKKHNKETKRKLSLINKGKKVSLEVKNKMSIGSLGMKHSEETKYKLSLMRKGEGNPNYQRVYTEEEKKRFGSPGLKHPNWKGGIGKEPYDFGFTREIKGKIKKRDGEKCQNETCFKNTDELTIHHINYNKKNSEFTNLITLCMSCNVRANYNRNFWKGYYSLLLMKKGEVE